MIVIMTYEEFMKMNPIQRCEYALDVAAQARDHGYEEVAQVWQELGTPTPNGWEESDEDGKGPWWIIYYEGDKTKIALRDTPEYEELVKLMGIKRA